MIAASLTLLSGCGYTARELYPTQYQTVAVPNFENRTFYQGVEFELREAIIKEIEQRTPYKVVRTQGAADTVLEGVVVTIESDSVSRTDNGGVPQEIELTVTVDFAWRDLRTGQTLRGYQGFASAGQYVPLRGVGEFYQTAQHRAVQRLAEDIVSTMRDDDW
ncbi:MAG: LptE family protein [Planctomycetota bacterium]